MQVTMSQMVLLLDLIIEKVAQVSWTNHKFKFKANMDITVEVHLLYQRGKLSLAIV